MSIALDEAELAFRRGEVPVGAVVLRDGEIIARDGNRVLELNDPTAHAEIMVIRAAGRKLKYERLCDCDIYVTLEPCMMCICAISMARVKRVYYGAKNIQDGAVDSGVSFFAMGVCRHIPEIYDGFMAQEASELLRSFFNRLRKFTQD